MGTLEFFVIVPAALSAAYFALELCSGNMERPIRLQYWTIFLSCLAVMFGIGGLLSAQRITSSPRPVISGTLVELSQLHYRAAASYFKVQLPDGRRVSLQASYDGPMLQDGELISVCYMSEYGAVLDLEVLSGTHLGWKLHESDDLGSAHLAAYSGLACGLLATIVWFRTQREKFGHG